MTIKANLLSNLPFKIFFIFKVLQNKERNVIASDINHHNDQYIEEFQSLNQAHIGK